MPANQQKHLEEEERLVEKLVAETPGILPFALIRSAEYMGYDPRAVRRALQRLIDADRIRVRVGLGLVVAK